MIYRILTLETYTNVFIVLLLNLLDLLCRSLRTNNPSDNLSSIRQDVFELLNLSLTIGHRYRSSLIEGNIWLLLTAL